MDKLCRHLEYLTLTRKRVVIPGVGTVGVYKLPAYFDAEKGMYYPPSRTFVFDYNDRVQDDMIAHSIVRKESIRYDSAVEYVSNVSELIRTDLRNGEPVTLGKVGVLRRQGERYSFVPGDALSALADVVWLPPVMCTLPVDNQAVMTHVAVPDESVYDEEKIIRWSGLKAFAKYAAVSLVAIAVALSLLLPSEKDNNMLQASVGLQELIKRGDAMPASDDMITSGNYSTPAIVVLLKSQDNDVEEFEPVVTPSMQPADEFTGMADVYIGADSGRYCLIVASLVSEEEASRFVSMHQSDPLTILVTNGRYRISLASGDDKNRMDRLARASDIIARYPGAWVAAR